MGRKRTGDGVSGSGNRAAGKSSSTRPCSSRKRRSGRPARAKLGQVEAGPLRRIAKRRGAECAEVPAQEVLHGLGLGRRRRFKPAVGQAVEVGPPHLPRARWRHPHHVQPQSCPRPRHGRETFGLQPPHEVASAEGPVREMQLQAPREGFHCFGLNPVALHPQPRLLPSPSDPLRHQGIVGRGHYMYGRAHQGALHRLALR